MVTCPKYIRHISGIESADESTRFTSRGGLSADMALEGRGVLAQQQLLHIGLSYEKAVREL
jgi:hypothetical protein